MMGRNRFLDDDDEAKMESAPIEATLAKEESNYRADGSIREPAAASFESSQTPAELLKSLAFKQASDKELQAVADALLLQARDTEKKKKKNKVKVVLSEKISEQPSEYFEKYDPSKQALPVESSLVAAELKNHRRTDSHRREGGMSGEEFIESCRKEHLEGVLPLRTNNHKEGMSGGDYLKLYHEKDKVDKRLIPSESLIRGFTTTTVHVLDSDMLDLARLIRSVSVSGVTVPEMRSPLINDARRVSQLCAHIETLASASKAPIKSAAIDAVTRVLQSANDGHAPSRDLLLSIAEGNERSDTRRLLIDCKNVSAHVRRAARELLQSVSSPALLSHACSICCDTTTDDVDPEFADFQISRESVNTASLNGFFGGKSQSSSPDVWKLFKSMVTLLFKSANELASKHYHDKKLSKKQGGGFMVIEFIRWQRYAVLLQAYAIYLKKHYSKNATEVDQDEWMQKASFDLASILVAVIGVAHDKLSGYQTMESVSKVVTETKIEKEETTTAWPMTTSGLFKKGRKNPYSDGNWKSLFEESKNLYEFETALSDVLSEGPLPIGNIKETLQKMFNKRYGLVIDEPVNSVKVRELLVISMIFKGFESQEEEEAE